MESPQGMFWFLKPKISLNLFVKAPRFADTGHESIIESQGCSP